MAKKSAPDFVYAKLALDVSDTLLRIVDMIMPPSANIDSQWIKARDLAYRLKELSERRLYHDAERRKQDHPVFFDSRDK
jgi:hypothetical protein